MSVLDLPNGPDNASHAGSWRGGTVAVKVLCHEGSRTAKLNALHESVVCAHVQHPNVVRRLLPVLLCCLLAWRCAITAHVQHEDAASHLTHSFAQP